MYATMEDTEAPRKKRKLDGGVTSSSANHVTNGDSSVGSSVTASGRAQSHLQFNPTVIQRLRQITKDCQKNFLPTPKPNGSKLPLGTGKRNEVSPERNASTSAPPDSSDFVISSAGSSPAHSPQPMDFEVLSTPPRPSKPMTDFKVLSTPQRSSEPNPVDFEVTATPPRSSKAKDSETDRSVTTETAHSSTGDRQKACSRLVERFEKSSTSVRTLSNGVCSDYKTQDQDSTSVEVIEEGDQTPVDSTAKTVHAVNGEVSLPAASKDVSSLSPKEQNSPALSDVESRVNAEENRGFNFNSEDVREMLKKVIEERMKQIERSMGSETAERLTSLEKENKALKEYAKKLEDSVKNLLKEKTKQRVTRAVQTQDPHWVTNLRAKTVATAPPQSSLTVTRPSGMGLTLTTTPTPRLTSTVAPLPGHTVPSRLENSSVNYRPAIQRPQAEPLRPRIPASSNMSPRQQQPGITYVPNYDPGPAARSSAGKAGGIRSAASASNFSTPTHPRFITATVRAAAPTAQPPIRMQGPIVSPGGPRSIAPPPNRPVPTVTVHPQTQTPSSATSVRVQQEPFGYTAQNVYNNGQPGPRFAVAPQIRPQHPQGGPRQISPGPRTPAYPQSPIQASPPQHIMQQQQTTQMPRPSVPIRANPPMQVQSSPHVINQPRPPQPQQAQQPGMRFYQQVTGPPRQVTPAQPSPNYGAVAVRPPPPPPAGIPPGVVQQPSAVAQASPQKEPPPKPSVSIAVVTSGIVLSWNMVLEERHAPIMNYQLFALQDGGTAENAHQWKKIGVVKALPLPMACTLTQFLPGNKYHFAVRATDEAGRLGPFSEPCTITLK